MTTPEPTHSTGSAGHAGSSARSEQATHSAQAEHPAGRLKELFVVAARPTLFVTLLYFLALLGAAAFITTELPRSDVGPAIGWQQWSFDSFADLVLHIGDKTRGARLWDVGTRLLAGLLGLLLLALPLRVLWVRAIWGRTLSAHSFSAGSPEAIYAAGAGEALPRAAEKNAASEPHQAGISDKGLVSYLVSLVRATLAYLLLLSACAIPLLLSTLVVPIALELSSGALPATRACIAAIALLPFGAVLIWTLCALDLGVMMAVTQVTPRTTGPVRSSLRSAHRYCHVYAFALFLGAAGKLLHRLVLGVPLASSPLWSAGLILIVLFVVLLPRGLWFAWSAAQLWRTDAAE